MSKVQRAFLDDCETMGIDPAEYIGEMYGTFLDDCESVGASVYWACWTESELTTTIESV